MRVAARRIASSVSETPLGLRAVTLECPCLQQDRGKRIPQVMRHDAEHLIAELRGLD